MRSPGASPPRAAEETLRSHSALVALGDFDGTGRAAVEEAEETEDQLEGYAKSLCEWLQGSRLLVEDGFVPRVTARSLVDLEVIAQTVLALSPSMYDSQVRVHGEAAHTETVVAACLDAGFTASHGREVAAGRLLSKALQAGERGLEPLSVVIALWKHILTYAVTCDEKHQHIESLQHMPAEVQQDVMNMITKLEQRLARPPRSQCRTSTTPSSSSASGEKRASRGAALDGLDQTPAGADGEGAEGPADSMRALVAENDQLRARVAALAEQLERHHVDGRRSARVLEGEFETFERSWQLEKQLQKKDDEIADLVQQVRLGRQASEEMQELVAELELLRSREQENATLRARLERSNQRLEEVGELRTALQTTRERINTVTSERDTLLQELGQLKGVGQQMDAWKAKVRDLELLCKERQNAQRATESRAREAEEGRERLQGEKAILEDQLLEASKRCAELSERGLLGSGGEIIEPFTPELRERLQHLETRNEALEKEVTEKGAQRVAELFVEVESLTSLSKHFEEKSQETSATLAACRADLEDVKEQLRVAEAGRRDADEQLAARTEDLRDLGATLAATEAERDALEARAAEAEAALEEARRSIAHLEDEHVDAERLQAELHGAQTDAEDLRERSQQKDEELRVVRARAEQLGHRVIELERQEKKQRRHIDELQNEAERLRQVAKRRDGLQDGERVWVQRQRALESGLCDLRAGLEDQARHSVAMRAEAEAAELRRGQLEDLLRRVAPMEYQRFVESSAFAHAAPPAPGVEFELAQANAEIRRLQAALHEQRLRVAEESQELAKTSMQLWQLQQSAIGDGGGPARGTLAARPPGTDEASLSDEAMSMGTCDSPEDCRRRALQEVQSELNVRHGVDGDRLHCTPDKGAMRTIDATRIRPSVGGPSAVRPSGADADGGGGRLPRSSILKKPKSMEAAASTGCLQENLPLNFDFSASSGSRRTTKVGRTVPPMPRRGLIM